METDTIQTIAEKLLNLLGLNEPSIHFESEGRKLTVFVNEGEWFDKQWLPRFVGDFERVLNLIAKKQNLENIFVDVNGYRKRRENLIIELAQAAAPKVLTTKTEVELPAMNAYERRLVHTELSSRPDVKTESVGEKKERRIIVRPL